MAKVNTRKRGKYWEYYFEAAKVEGKRSKISKGGYPTRKEAFIEGTKALEKYNSSGLNFVPSEISFNDYIDFWFKEYAEANLKPETLTNYRKRIKNHIKPAFARYKLKSITPAVLQSFINEKFNQGYSRNTMKSIKGILSKAFQMAVEPFRFIGTNPMLYIHRLDPSLTISTINNIFLITPTGLKNENGIIFVCYNNNKMVYVNPYVYAGETTIPFTTTETYDKVKVMVWESLETCVPLCEAEEVPLN